MYILYISTLLGKGIQDKKKSFFLSALQKRCIQPLFFFRNLHIKKLCALIYVY